MTPSLTTLRIFLRQWNILPLRDSSVHVIISQLLFSWSWKTKKQKNKKRKEKVGWLLTSFLNLTQKRTVEPSHSLPRCLSSVFRTTQTQGWGDIGRWPHWHQTKDIKRWAQPDSATAVSVGTATPSIPCRASTQPQERAVSWVNSPFTSVHREETHERAF